MYRDSEQSHDDANDRAAVLPTKVCPSEDETARCKYSEEFVLPNRLHCAAADGLITDGVHCLFSLLPFLNEHS